ncbi:MAG: hypothetical protein H0V81_15955 [Solirubrobacterales bacterium]|nr:hypothetical protein [Solirubrobacterales bacterium]
MTTPSVLAAGLLAAALLPSVALAQKPPKDPKPVTPPKGAAALTLAAKPNPVVFTRPVVLSGKLSGVNPDNGVTVRLERDDTRPFGDSYKPTGLTATTANGGRYSFTLKPARNTQYRAIAKASPTVTSAPRLVLVRPLVGLRVSTRSPRAGRLVRFSGIVLPARDGATALVQRRTSTGRFVTVRRTRLRDSSPGSKYSVRVRVRSSGAYRVKLPGTPELVNGFSRTVKLTTR